MVAIDTETDGLDAMRARLIGLSLATRPGRACYVPLGHAGLEAQVSVAEAVAMLAPLLTDPTVLKIYQNAKFDRMVMARAGFPEAAPFDDTMLISYAQEAGMHGHGMDELSQLHLGHRRSPMTRSPAPAAAASPSPTCRSTAPPPTPPRTRT